MTVTVTLPLPDQDATERLAERLGRVLRPGDAVALAGDLGAGKTTLARALIRSRPGGGEEVPSPTFTLCQIYDTEPTAIWHFDLYRLERPEDAWELGLEEALADGAALIEWPERLGGLMPADALTLKLALDGADGWRSVVLTGPSSWGERIEEVASGR